MTTNPRHAAAYAVLLAMLAGAALRIGLMFDRELSFDEAATAFFARLTMADLWGDTGRLETNPPLFYMIAAALERMGLPAEYFRLASIAADVASIGLAALLARRFSNQFAAVAAAWLVATSPVMVDVSVEARAYAMLATLGLAGVLQTIRVLDDGRARDFAVLVLVEVAALYTHNTAVIMLAGLNGMALLAWAGRRPRDMRLARRWLAAQAVVALAWLPWLPVVFGQAVDDLAQFWIARPGLMALRYEVQKIAGQPMVAWPQPLVDLMFMALSALGMVALWVGLRRDRGLVLGLGLMVLAGVPVAIWLISQWRPLMNGRVLLWLVPLHLVLVASALAWRPRWAAAALLAGLVVVQLSAFPAWRAARQGENWRDVAAMLGEGMREGDALYLSPAPVMLLLTHHGWQPAGHALYARPEWRWYRRFPGMLVAPDAAVATLAALPRLWIVTRRDARSHAALVGALAVTMTEMRVQRTGRQDSGIDVSVLTQR